jgi:type I restriction enzyme S subunit
MSRYKRYERYKDSGVEWIGEIPEEWNVKKGRYFLTIYGGYAPDLVIESQNGIDYYKVDDLNQIGRQLFLECAERKIDITEEVKPVKPPVILIPKRGAAIFTNKVRISNNVCIFDSNVMGIKSGDKADIKYVSYSLLSRRLDDIADVSSIPQINNKHINVIYFPYPSIEEQTAIANFLDQKTAEIDGLIADKEKLIELLQEKRQAVITEAVTKGLNPNVRLKDSGIEWIGEIPEHWGVSKIKFTTYVKGRIGWQGLRADEFIDEGPYLVTGTDFVDGLVNWDSCYHISMERYNEAPPIQLRENDLLITKDGTIGKVAIVKNKPKYAILNSGIFVTRPKNSAYLTEFMYWILNSQVFNKFIQYMSLGSTIVHLYQQTFENFSFPITNLNEQKTIAHFLDRKVAEIDGLISDIKLQIQKLKEYRQSLISEAVTGKIDVREFGSISEVI